MKRIFIAIAFVILSWIGNSAMAQSNDLFYHSIRSPHANQMNPAFFPTESMLYISLPGIGVNFNSPLSISDILTYQPGDSVSRIDINSITEKLKQNSIVGLGAEVDLLGIGFSFGSNYITLGSRLIANISLGLPVDAMNLITLGNMDANGNPISEVTLLDGELFNASAYLENSIGFGHEFESLGLTVGGKFKMLGGIAGITTNNTQVKLNTASDMSTMSATVYYNIMAGSCLALDTVNFGFMPAEDLMDYMPSINGYAFDLGANYNWKDFSFSASVINLSKGLHWKENAYAISPEGGSGSFTFDGFDLSNSGFLNGGNINTDTLINYFKANLDGLKPKNSGADFYQSIPTKLNLGAAYRVKDWIKVGLLYHGEWAHGWFGNKNSSSKNPYRSAVTLSGSMNFANWIELLVANSAFNDGNSTDFFNPGVGLILTPFSILQIHVMADYVSSIYAVEAKDIKVRAGLNLLFGSQRYKKAKKAAKEEVIIIEEAGETKVEDQKVEENQ